MLKRKRNQEESKGNDAKKRRRRRRVKRNQEEKDESTTTEVSNFIPPEIINQILLNLPVKSLLRFSSVSKSWKSTIFASWFTKKYRGNGILIATNYDKLSSLNLPGDKNSIGHAKTLFCPMSEKPILLLDFSNELLLCVRVRTSLFLWNPSVNTYRQIHSISDPYYVCGLGYDAVADDYKLLYVLNEEVMVYSLRRDSWREIQPPQVPVPRFCIKSCVSVNGILHWKSWERSAESYAIVSFDLSTEKFGEIAGPKYTRWQEDMQITASKGKLCLCFYYEYTRRSRFVMWTMNDHGVAESWTKTLEIKFDRGPILAVMESFHEMTYLYSYDDGRILFKSSGSTNGSLLFVCEGNKVQTIGKVNRQFSDWFFHVESLISPNMW